MRSDMTVDVSKPESLVHIVVCMIWHWAFHYYTMDVNTFKITGHCGKCRREWNDT